MKELQSVIAQQNIKGVITQQNIKGAIKQQNITAVMSEITTRPTADRFPGPYEVTPAIIEQKLPTKQKVMDKDLTIREIPYYAVTNNSNGITVTIGNEGLKWE